MSRWMIRLFPIAVLSQFLATTAWADLGGCEDSPENPTVVLSLLCAAAAGIPWVKAQVAARRGNRVH